MTVQQNSYRGSKLADKKHGFGQWTTDYWTHIGWFECGKPHGFGIRHYNNDNEGENEQHKVDGGLWEDQTLVRMGFLFENGFNYQLKQIYGSDDQFIFMEDDGIDFKSFLQIPRYPSKTLDMPSQSTKLVFSQHDAQMARELHSRIESDLASYIDNEKHLPLDKGVLDVKVTQYKKQQTVIAMQIIDALADGLMKTFWSNILSKHHFDAEQVDMRDDLEELMSAADHGPLSRRIIATFRAIENNDYVYVLECLRDGVHVGSRDLANYSLTHCACLFANVPILNVLLKSGALFFPAYHFTPLNMVLMLHYQYKLKNTVIVKKQVRRVKMAHRIHAGMPRQRPKSALSSASMSESGYMSLTYDKIFSQDVSFQQNQNSRPQSAAVASRSSLSRATPDRPSTASDYKNRKWRRVHRPTTATISEAGRTEDDVESIDGFEHHFQLRRNYRRVVKLLISNGVPKYDSSCPYILSELFWPILASDPLMVDDLLLAGCDPQKAVHLAGLCLKPIHLATETHPDILSSLIASRSNPEEKVLQLKHEGTNSKFGLSFEKQLAKESNSNTLVRVTIAGSLLQMKKLVTAGANLNSCHKDHSILGLAIKNGHTELAQLLLESGADPNGVQPCGGTPLSLVLHPATDSNMTLREKVALIDKLVDHGAMVPALFNYAKHRINTVDYVNHMLHPQTGPPPIKGFFGNLNEDEKRNYLARAELETYIVAIARQQMERQVQTEGSATTACFECCAARKRLTIDTHFKVIAFCSVRCRKVFWRLNPSRREIRSRPRRKFNFDSFYLKSTLKDNYSYN